MMENMKNISKAIVAAQKSFAPALKTNTNPHFKSRYVGLDGCIEAVIDSLHNNGIALIQRNHDCENGVMVETILLHESGEEFSGGILHVPAIKSDPQAFGSALTYARRYSLMATCGIAPEDDDGNSATRPQSPPSNVKPFDLVSAINTMQKCKTLDELKDVFGAAYKQGNDTQKADLKATYDTIKSLIEGVK
jgi:hypothetical protein